MAGKWRKEMPKKLKEFMREGYSFHGACGCLGISKVTGYAWRDSHEEWMEAMDEGRALRMKFLEDQAVSMIAFSKDRSAALAIFLLKTADREQYGEKYEAKAPVDPMDKMPDDELEKKAIQVMKSRGLKIVGTTKTP